MSFLIPSFNLYMPVLCSRADNVSNFMEADSIFGPVIFLVSFRFGILIRFTWGWSSLHLRISMIFLFYVGRVVVLCTNIMQHCTLSLCLIVLRMSLRCLISYKVLPSLTIIMIKMILQKWIIAKWLIDCQLLSSGG